MAVSTVVSGLVAASEPGPDGGVQTVRAVVFNLMLITVAIGLATVIYGDFVLMWRALWIAEATSLVSLALEWTKRL